MRQAYQPVPQKEVVQQKRVRALRLEDIQKSGPVVRGDPRYRPELDFDDDGVVEEFELFFAEILYRAKQGKKVDLSDDVWGCAIFTTVTDLPAILSCKFTYENVLRFAYVLFVSVLNLALQFGLLYWISIYVMAPSMKITQNIYGQFHHDVFTTDSIFQPNQFETFPDASDLCQFPLFDRYFTSAVLFLWCSQCFLEIRSSQRIFTGMSSLPTLPTGISHVLMIHEGLKETDSHDSLTRIEQRLDELHSDLSGDMALLAEICARLHEVIGDNIGDSGSDEKYLVCLTPITRFSIAALVLVPRMLIIISLMIMGCIWLTATDRFDSLILNALALEFVVKVDNLLFLLFFPVSLHGQVENLKVAMPLEDEHGFDEFSEHAFGGAANGLQKEAQELLKAAKGALTDISGYYRSFVYLAMVVVFVAAFQLLQPVVPGYDWDITEACVEYIDQWSTPKYGLSHANKIISCILGKEACFPYGPAVGAYELVDA